MRVLVVEDEPRLADAIAEWLRDETHAVDVAHDGSAALERLTVNDYDVLVLDRDIPVVHGDEVCRQVVASAALTRVLMLTAAAEVTDRVTGSAWAPTTTSPSRSRSRSSPPGCLPSDADPGPPLLRCCAAARSPSTRLAARCSAATGTCRCPRRSSRC